MKCINFGEKGLGYILGYFFHKTHLVTLRRSHSPPASWRASSDQGCQMESIFSDQTPLNSVNYGKPVNGKFWQLL
jgi:hypothetical protein